jgi:hypothetical protein
MKRTITITDANGKQATIPDGANVQLPNGDIVSANHFALMVKHGLTDPNWTPKFSQEAIEADRNNLWNYESWAGNQ